ncbi:MAG: ABC transporter substrate-binding protein [Parafilimonas sp.]
MHPAIRKLFFICFFIVGFINVKAADTIQAPVRIAVLVPLNLDSAFTGNNYNLSDSRISQYFLSGLDFYSGVMMAIDSLQKENANIEVWIYDTHKQNQTMQQLTTAMQPMNFSLIIASISTSMEQQAISDFSAKNSIPVISATFPNDTYLNSNPFFVIINSTWQTHIDAVYDYLLKYYKSKKITLFTRKGFLENAITQELQKMNTNRLVNFSTIILSDDFSDNDVLKHLDSTSQNVVLCGSLYENFGQSLIKTLNDNGQTYSTVLIGMPTWNGMTGTTGSDAENIQIVMTTPYNYFSDSSNVETIADEYKQTYNSRPSDMVLKGYETMYHFTKLLLQNPDNFINDVSDTAYTISNNYNFEPIRLSQTSFVPDYLENKKIYFIRIVQGKIQSVN